MTKKPTCLHPRLIYSRDVDFLLRDAIYLYMDGKHYPLDDYQHLRHIDVFRAFLRHEFRYHKEEYIIMKGKYRGERITEDNIDNYYIVDRFGIQHNIFSYVTCGKCEICQANWKYSLCSRVASDYETFGRSPLYFITITYDTPHLPEDKQVHKDEIQAWLKRFRVALNRKGKKITGDDKTANELRYIMSGEYGGKKGRPHYHILLWNLPTWLTTVNHAAEANMTEMIHNIGYDCWCVPHRGSQSKEHKCIARCFVVQYVRNYGTRGGASSAAAYCAKYMSKQHDKGAFVTWCRGTKLTQGLGWKFVEKNKEVWLNDPLNGIHTSDGTQIFLCPYFINKLVPSYAGSIPVIYRRMAATLSYLGTHSQYARVTLRRYMHNETFQRLVHLGKMAHNYDDWLYFTDIDYNPVKEYVEAHPELCSHEREFDWHDDESIQEIYMRKVFREKSVGYISTNGDYEAANELSLENSESFRAWFSSLIIELGNAPLDWQQIDHSVSERYRIKEILSRPSSAPYHDRVAKAMEALRRQIITEKDGQ